MNRCGVSLPKEKAATQRAAAFSNKILAVSYSHMGRPHTTIGAERFHFRVRNGIGWFPLAIAARKTVGVIGHRGLDHSRMLRINNNLDLLTSCQASHTCRFAYFAKMFWRYMAKPHEQLVLVSFIHY